MDPASESPNTNGGVATIEQPAAPAPEVHSDGLIPNPGAAESIPAPLSSTAAADVDTALKTGGADTLGAAPIPEAATPTGPNPAGPDAALSGFGNDVNGQPITENALTAASASPANPSNPFGTPDQQTLNATHQAMVAKKAEAQAAAPKPPLHKRVLGALGFGGGSAVSTPTVTPGEHLTTNENGALVTPPVPNVTPEAATAVEAAAVQVTDPNASIAERSKQMDEAMKQGAVAGNAILEPAPDAQASSSALPSPAEISTPSQTGISTPSEAAAPSVAMPEQQQTPDELNAKATAQVDEALAAGGADNLGSSSALEAPAASTIEAPAQVSGTPGAESTPLNAKAMTDVDTALAAGGADTLGAPAVETQPPTIPDPGHGLPLESTPTPSATTAEQFRDPLAVGPTIPGEVPPAPVGLTTPGASIPDASTPVTEQPAAAGIEPPSTGMGIPAPEAAVPASEAVLPPAPVVEPVSADPQPAAPTVSVDGSASLETAATTTAEDPTGTSGTGTPPTATS